MTATETTMMMTTISTTTSRPSISASVGLAPAEADNKQLSISETKNASRISAGLAPAKAAT